MNAAELFKAAYALEQEGSYGRAYELLRRCDQLQSSDGADVGATVLTKAGLLRLSPMWWANLEHNDLRLRRCVPGDAIFFRRCFEDRDFSNQFNRQPPWSGDLGNALLKSGNLSPVQTGLLMWVIESVVTGPIGLASFSSIDTRNYRMELSIGFPGNVPSTLGVKATLMMLHFAFFLMPFNKVYSYIYEDNAKALHNALRFGFVHEGTLSDHFNIHGHGFVNVNLIGLTRAQVKNDVTLKSLAQRRIGQKW